MAQTTGAQVRSDADRIREHYVIERELADRLRRASRDARGDLYTRVYDELFERVPFHPQLLRRDLPEDSRRRVERQLSLLAPYLHARATYLEVGPGDCALAVAVARRVRWVYAVEVSNKICADIDWPSNADLVLSNGRSVPVPAGSVDVAYSHQLMEHLHPDDAVDQIANLHRALAAGGVYICVTPNRLGGPHDISQHFDRVAAGLHLKEYTYRELAALFRRTGFSRLRGVVRIKGSSLALPVAVLVACESLLSGLPFRLRRAIARSRPYRHLLEICLVGTKGR